MNSKYKVTKFVKGRLENIRLRFIPTLGKFEDIEQYESPYEFHSKMNAAANDDTFKTDFNSENQLDDETDLPF